MTRATLMREMKPMEQSVFETSLHFEPVPHPGVPHEEPKTKIVEKFVYDEPEEEDDSSDVETQESSSPMDKQSQGNQNLQPIIVQEPTKATNSISIMTQSLRKFFKVVTKHHAALIMTGILALSLVFNPLPAMAVPSGGRMGGSYSSKSRSAPRTSSSYGSRSSYSRGYSRGYSTGASYGRGPSIYVNPFSYRPLLSPFWGPSYYNAQPGVIVQRRGPGLGTFLVLGGLAFAVANAFSNFPSSADTWGEVSSALGPGVSVAQVSVAMDVPRRDDPNSILSVLDRLAYTAKTDSRVGLQNLTSQVALELLRRKSSIVSASTSYKHHNNRDQAQRQFNNMSIQERGKFERETKSVYGGVDYTKENRPKLTGESRLNSPQATMAVITIVLAIEGDSTKIPTIRSIADVEHALSQIASDSKVDNCLQSAEILWTPEERTDTLTARDIVADYPGLRTV
eukprot:CAMPEP_0195262378 /NCGR_PEP_ID=MMETSP0706-20130129/9721_1 /TAXON_ID=33640 /ORGANISM="Asterionellopsis glacialis, Strain CCMP134" /LENGTH=452 /DNA_ID=CAMNT_0040316451 /DNA_START=195 /DNA_END=1553 /DNA_ORIENTATION=-